MSAICFIFVYFYWGRGTGGMCVIRLVVNRYVWRGGGRTDVTRQPNLRIEVELLQALLEFVLNLSPP